MKPLAVLFCAIVAVPPAWAASPSLLLEAGAGGGYDDNLNLASAASQREGDGFGTSWLTAGASIPASEHVRIGLSGGYSGTYYADFDDLTVHALAVRSSARVSVRESTSVTLGVGAARGWYGDDDRNAAVYDAALGWRERATARTAVTAGYRYASHAAEAATFSARRNRVSVGGEFAPTAGAWLGFGYAMEVGRSVFYQSAATPIPSGGRGRRASTTFGTNQVAFNAEATTHTVSAKWDQEAGDSWSVHVEYAHAVISADPGDARDNLVWASVAYRY
jgi:hypothetical protein